MIGLACGVGLGFLFFAHLRYSVESLASVRQPLAFMARGYFFRLLMFAVGMMVVAKLGTFDLMSAALGVVLVRSRMIRSVRWS